MSKFKENMESVKNENNLDKNFLVVRKEKDYDDVYTIPVISFDTENEAEKWIDHEYEYQSMRNDDSYEIKEQ